MTTYVEARTSIATAIEAGLSAGYSTLDVFWENRGEVDTNNVGDRYMKVDIDFLDSRQITVEFNPAKRVFGEIVLTFFVKDGAGTLETLTWKDYFDSLLSHKRLGGVQTFTATPGSKRSLKGWRSTEMTVPFTFDTLG